MKFLKLAIPAFFFFFLCSCGTLKYRDIQQDFNNAVQNDNITSEVPGSDPQASYQSIILNLTEDFIGGLDARLQGNAYVLKSIAQWRTGQFKDALNSVDKASAKQLGARDKVMVQLLPIMIAESSLMKGFSQKEGIPYDNYGNYLNKFAGFYRMLNSIDNGTESADSIKFYVAYQGWRIMSNWKIVASSVKPATKITDALTKAQSALSKDLNSVITDFKSRIPSTHPLAQLILYNQSR